jgi:predicted MFS family arabinose efflux permease
VPLADAQWSLTITLLVGAVATPTMGRLGDGPRRRQVILGALAVVVAGSVLAALPLDFWYLVAGRALQGVGLGLTPLAMATARDALPAERSRSTVALLSITTVAGVGLGYPLTGLIAQYASVRTAFWFGAAVSAAALVAAAMVVPSTADRPRRRLDVLGAVLLGAALAGLLLALSEAEVWGWTSGRTLGLAAASLLVLGLWVVHERRARYPLVDLSLLRHRAVLTADVTALLAGVGMYLLMSLVMRFVQTPESAGYGFGSSVVVAGLVLLPFSVASFAASKVAPVIARRTSPDIVLPVGSVMFFLAMLAFLLVRDSLWQVLLTMSVAGLGVGCTFAAMPGLIVRSVPRAETGSAMSFNQVLRYVGYSAGSALSATVLEAHTAAGSALPSDDGYGAAALLGCVVWAVTVVVGLVLPRRRAAVREAEGVEEAVLVEERVAVGR